MMKVLTFGTRWLSCRTWVALTFLLVHADAALSQTAGPGLPCAGAALPAYAAPGVPPAVMTWRDRDLAAAGWFPPTCAGWTSPRSRLLVTLAGSLRFDGPVEDLLDRIGAISSFRSLRYWSVTDRAWRPLLNETYALRGADPRLRRPDFAAAELRLGTEVYFLQRDGRSTADVVYRMRIQERDTSRARITIENVTPVRFYLVTLFPPGSLQSTIYLNRISLGVWGVYYVTRVTDEASSMALGHEASYINRAAALYRHLVGVPTDQEPPLAP